MSAGRKGEEGESEFRKEVREESDAKGKRGGEEEEGGKREETRKRRDEGGREEGRESVGKRVKVERYRARGRRAERDRRHGRLAHSSYLPPRCCLLHPLCRRPASW